MFFFFSSRRRHTRCSRDWSSDVCSSDLKQALALAERYKNKEISLHGLLTATGRLEVKLDRVLNNPGRDPANRRFRNHLDHERPYLFTFLYCPGLDATNNVSERAIRALRSEEHTSELQSRLHLVC